MSSICVIDGHPDASGQHFCHAIAAAYEAGAEEEGHKVSLIRTGALEMDFLHQPEDFTRPPPEPVLSEREKISAADHVVIIFPLWLGGMPSNLRCFLELASCGQFLLGEPESSTQWPRKMMKGKSARLFVTMGMPGAAYHLIFGAHSLKAIEKGMLGISGFKPVRHTIHGGVEAADDATRKKWLDEARELGRKAH